MSLAILVPMVVVGVSLVIAAIHFSGLSHRTRIGDEALAGMSEAVGAVRDQDAVMARRLTLRAQR